MASSLEEPIDSGPHASDVDVEEPRTKHRRGSVVPWSRRYEEFHARFRAQHPNGRLDQAYCDPATWPTVVVAGPKARISGCCRECGALFDHHPTELLREEYTRLPHCKCQRDTEEGKSAAWSERNAEFLRRFLELHPKGKLDADFVDPVKWRQLTAVQGARTKVTGACTGCAAAPFSSDLSDLVNKHRPKLPGCRCLATLRRPEAYIREEQSWAGRRQEFFDRMTQMRPQLKLEARTDTDEQWAIRLQEARGKTKLEGECEVCSARVTKMVYELLEDRPHCVERCGRKPDQRGSEAARASAQHTKGPDGRQDQPAILSMIRRRHPHVQLDPKFLDPARWLHMKGLSKLEGSCRDCGANLSCSISNAKKQGFGRCDCADLAKARTAADSKLSGSHEILAVRFQEFADQRHAVVDCRCLVCGWESSGTRASALGSPPCECNNQACWGTPAGYHKFVGVVEDSNKLDHVQALFDEAWWCQNVQNSKTAVPFRCTACGVEKSVLVTSVQQGNGMGCSCRRSNERLEAQLGVWGLAFDAEVKVGKNPDTGRHLLADYLIRGSRPPTFLELDGPKHFTSKFNGHESKSSAKRDILKEKAITSDGAVLIRLDQSAIWTAGWEDFLAKALSFVASLGGGSTGCVIHPDVPTYVEESAYADAHSASGELPLCEVVPFEGARLRAAQTVSRTQ